MAQVGKRKELHEQATYEVIPVKKEKLSYEDIVAEIIEESLDCDIIESESKKLVAETEEESSECEIIKPENRKLFAEIKEESSDCEIIKSENLKVVAEIKEESSDCEIIKPELMKLVAEIKEESSKCEVIKPESMKIVAEMPENIKLEEETSPFTFVSCDEGFEESREDGNAVAEKCPLGTSAPEVKLRKFVLSTPDWEGARIVPIYECILCGKHYYDTIFTNVMKLHVMSHLDSSDEVPVMDYFKRVTDPTWSREVFNCEVCYEVFEDSNKLVKHKFTHSDLKPFECRICSKRFSQEAILNVHMRTHRAEFKCITCYVTFDKREDLEKHIVRTHRAEFKCIACYATFDKREDLEKHIADLEKHKVRTHRAEFKCITCYATFDNREDLEKHIARAVHLSRKSVGSSFPSLNYSS